jgi:hypothetical protein
MMSYQEWQNQVWGTLNFNFLLDTKGNDSYRMFYKTSQVDSVDPTGTTLCTDSLRRSSR